ncbi:MAG TPA: threonine--tRNA ligase, partial [Candidatus Paceibacterota bacterium]|nr:threonine--tRNA ligase [Candidatus Paceibacterota bacterium]
AEEALRKIIKKNGETAVEAPGEAAFYGPKIDFMARDAIGREHQVATIQLDMNQPERFDLFCINEKSEKERIVMIHAAIMGSIERFMSVLIEHVAGAFPLWLAPVQVKVLPISDKQLDYAKGVFEKLKEAGIRAELDESNESLGKKVRQAKTEKVPYLAVIGDKEKESGTVTVESRSDQTKVGSVKEGTKVEEFINKLREEIKTKKN